MAIKFFRDPLVSLHANEKKEIVKNDSLFNRFSNDFLYVINML